MHLSRGPCVRKFPYPVRPLVIQRLGGVVKSAACEHGQPRVLGKVGIGQRALAEYENAAFVARDAAFVAATGAEAGRYVHGCFTSEGGRSNRITVSAPKR